MSRRLFQRRGRPHCGICEQCNEFGSTARVLANGERAGYDDLSVGRWLCVKCVEKVKVRRESIRNALLLDRSL